MVSGPTGTNGLNLCCIKHVEYYQYMYTCMYISKTQTQLNLSWLSSFTRKLLKTLQEQYMCIHVHVPYKQEHHNCTYNVHVHVFVYLNNWHMHIGVLIITSGIFFNCCIFNSFSSRNILSCCER